VYFRRSESSPQQIISSLRCSPWWTRHGIARTRVESNLRRSSGTNQLEQRRRTPIRLLVRRKRKTTAISNFTLGCVSANRLGILPDQEINPIASTWAPPKTRYTTGRWLLLLLPIVIATTRTSSTKLGRRRWIISIEGLLTQKLLTSK